MTRSSAQVLGVALGCALVSPACAEPLQHKPIEMEPIGTVKNTARSSKDEGDGGASTPTTQTTPAPGGQGPSACTGDNFENLDSTLEECRTAMPKSNEVPSNMKEKLDVKLTAASIATTPGGRVDLLLVIRNKSNGDVPLYFTGDPNPRFEVEALDAKGRRVDIPPGKPPPWPKGTGPSAREVKASRVTLEKGGSARVKLTWDAVKMKWAPDRAKKWEGRGYPRVPAGSLPAGKYTLRVVVPLLGEIEVPKVQVDVS